MKCLSPVSIPAKKVREANLGKGELRHLRARRAKALREVPCGHCHPCRTNARLQNCERVLWDFRRVAGVPFLLTLTYSDESLRWSDEVEAGELSAEQAKLYARILKRSQNGAYLAKHDERKLSIIQGHNPPMPTVRGRDIFKWVNLVRNRFGDSLLVLPCREYGTALGRPHAHALVGPRQAGMSQGDIQWLRERWPHGHTHVLPAVNDKALQYIVKDSQKGSWEREYYIADNREAPKVHWPRKPYIGHSMEAVIQQGMDTLTKAYSPMEVELKLQGPEQVLKWFRQGGYHRPFGATAILKVFTAAIACGLRDEVAVEQVRQIMDFAAWDKRCETDPDDMKFSPEMAEKKVEALNDAKAKSDRAKRRHASILGRKSSRGRHSEA